MPLIVAAVLAHIAGLLARELTTAVAATAAAGLLGARVHRAGVASSTRTRVFGGALLAAIAGAGIVRRDLAERARAACLAARGASDAFVWLEADATPGATVRGTWAWRHCRLPITLRVADGDANAGVAVRVRGAVVPGGTALRGIDVTITPAAHTPSRTRAWRAAINRSLDRAFGGGEPAAFARALVTGDQSLVSVESRDRWADAGLVHMLSVSGLHITIIIDAVARVLRWSGRSRTQRDLLAVGLVAGYVWLLGTPAPALRASLTAALSLAALALQRPPNPWAIWALACAAPLHDARAPVDLGYQLSALGAAGLVVAGTWHRRQRHTTEPSPVEHRTLVRAMQRVRRTVVREVVTGVIATGVTLPIVLWVFGRVSVIAPVANIVAAPVMSLVQPLLFLVVLCAPVPEAAAAMAEVTRVALAITDGLAHLFAAVPGATLRVAPSAAVVVVATVLIGAMIWTLVGRTTRRRARTGLVVTALGALPWLDRVRPFDGACALHVIDVGQGDALALRTGRGRWVLVDAGPAWRGGDAGQRAVIPYLARHGGDVALLVLSHADLDHAGGALTLLRARTPPVVWDPGFAARAPHYAALLEGSGRATRWHRARRGDTIDLDDLHLEVLAPDRAWLAASRETNAASVVLRATCMATATRPAVRFLLTGDAEAAQEAYLVSTTGERLAADVLKVPHHGSRSSSTPDFLDAVAPTMAVVSVGAGNRYGHPAPEVLSRYAERGIALFRTDRDGSIVIRAGPRGPEVAPP
ncbi:MAG: DNA internalization-related competence protein ComEC/Rec2 [Gemmatimonadaceae bacterium]|nr:DNA internalization-related competence protein ComEC/Rec2 [Gemmatimonadaceae bacterium]